jgi:hypothetical protein
MRPTTITTGKLSILVATAAWAVSSPAHADTVYLNTPPGFVPQIQSSVAGAKYRLDGNNWDMALHSGTGTNDPQPAPADFVQAELGSLAALSNVTYRFTVTHQAGVGFSYTMTNLGTNAATTLSWGTGLAGTNVQTLQRWSGSGLDGIDHAPTDPFNFLLIEARAQRGAGDTNPPEPDSSMSFSNLSFSGTGLTTSGSLLAGSTNENAAGSAWTPSGGASEAGRYWQFIYSDVDLSDYDWTFSADVAGFANTNSGQELLRFELTAKNVTPVPLPAGAWLLLSGLAGFGVAARRRR